MIRFELTIHVRQADRKYRVSIKDLHTREYIAINESNRLETAYNASISVLSITERDLVGTRDASNTLVISEFTTVLDAAFLNRITI